MIQIYKLNQNEPINLESLDTITPWWNKMVNKKIRKCKDFISKFGLQANDYISFDKVETVEIDVFFKAVNNYLNFYIPKIKIIVADRQAFKKFDNSIINYMKLNGYASAILTMINFYDQVVSKNNVKLTRLEAVKYANNFIEQKWKRYQKEVIVGFGHSEIIKDVVKQVFNEVIIFKNNVFDTRTIIATIVKYAARLLKTNEISEKQFLNIMYLSYLQLSFNEGFLELYNQFIFNLN